MDPMLENMNAELIDAMKQDIFATCTQLCEKDNLAKFYWGTMWMSGGYPMYCIKIDTYSTVSGSLIDCPPYTVRILHSLMGLTDRGKIDAARERNRAKMHAYVDAKVKELQDSLNADRARYNVLFKDLDEILYADEVNGKGWENDQNSTYSRLAMALKRLGS